MIEKLDEDKAVSLAYKLNEVIEVVNGLTEEPRQCKTCGGAGFINERLVLGGKAFDADICPECNGARYLESPPLKPELQAEIERLRKLLKDGCEVDECEGCNHIGASDDMRTDSEGLYLCQKCYDAMVAEAKEPQSEAMVAEAKEPKSEAQELAEEINRRFSGVCCIRAKESEWRNVRLTGFHPTPDGSNPNSFCITQRAARALLGLEPK